VVCEGLKTEVNYFEEIRQEARIPTLHVRVIHSPQGQEPQQIVEGAIAEFGKTRGFERVYAVFDRDEHLTYANAIDMAEAHSGKLRNDEKVAVSFEAVVSVPSFELWLLLHFDNIQGWLHRAEALDRLKQHLQGYEKGRKGTYAATVEHLVTAMQRATALKGRFSRLPGNDAYTDVHELVKVLRALKDAAV
jgi:hypothetical protein